jgi:alpha-methylacyl-CoA racemase
MGPLADIRVLDLSRLAPGPYASMLLADLGAEVIMISGGRAGQASPGLSRGKRQITLDLKSAKARAAFHTLAVAADVVLEGFRPGVADRIGAGYTELSAINSRLVYCSLTGFGQTGSRAARAGHDINYISVAGVLGAIERPGERPAPNLNLVADFGGGGMLAAFGIVAALFERERSGKGQRVDVDMVGGVVSMMAMHYALFGTPLFPGRGDGWLAGNAPFYRCYQCADGRYVAVGAIEPAFFRELWTTLKLGDVPDHHNRANWPEIGARLESVFRARSRDDWAERFAAKDACVTPVLDPREAQAFGPDREQGVFLPDGRPAPVPRFSRTPGESGEPATGDETAAILREAGVSEADIEELAG